MATLAVSTRLEEQAEKLKEDIVNLEEERHALLEARMDSHWMYTAFDEMADLMWPQGDPDTESDTDTDTDSEDGDVGNQLGGRGGGSGGGGCAVM